MAFMHLSVKGLVLRFSCKRRSEPPKSDAVETTDTVVRFVSKAPATWQPVYKPPPRTVYISDDIWDVVRTVREQEAYRKSVDEYKPIVPPAT